MMKITQMSLMNYSQKKKYEKKEKNRDIKIKKENEYLDML